MSGIEIAGLVLAAFPIILNCLDYYRRSFEPLEEWWRFENELVSFTDDIRHQMMRYNQNLLQLLDPIIADYDSLLALAGDAEDPRWTDGSLNNALEQRLAEEYERYIRTIQRMNAIMEDLHKLLQVKDGSVRKRPMVSIDFITHICSLGDMD